MRRNRQIVSQAAAQYNAAVRRDKMSAGERLNQETIMAAAFKQLTTFLRELGVESVAHTSKGYLAHAIGVYNDLKSWGCDEELAHVGLFHSIYGTELFQGFTLPLERRGEIQDLIGERAERLSYLNCAMDRAHFDAQISKPAPHSIRDRFTGVDHAISDRDFDALCTVHLCDWLEQVERSQKWDYRRSAYRALAERLGGVAKQSYDRVFANEPATATT
jgi:hypothetical protein